MGGSKKTVSPGWTKSQVTYLWVGASALLLFSAFGTYGMRALDGWNEGGCTWSSIHDTLYYTFVDLLWSCGICFVVYAGLFGYGGVCTRVLAWDMFSPISRLVYGVYLVHPIVMHLLWDSGNRLQNWFEIWMWT